MKNYLVLVLALGTIAPMCAMNNNNQRRRNARENDRNAFQVARPKKNENNFFKKYIDMRGILNEFLDRFYEDEGTEHGCTAVAIVSALRLGNLPLTLETGRETTIEEFFNPIELKKCLIQFLTRWFEGRLRKWHIADALEGLQNSLKMDAVKQEFGNHEWIDIKRTLDTLIAYYGGEEVDDIEDAIDLDKLPKFFGLLLKDYFIIDELNNALNNALQGTALTKSVLLDCLDIEEIASRNGYDEVPNADGIRETIELFFALMEDDKATLFQVFEILGHYRATKNVDDASDESEDRRPARRSAVHRGARPVVRSHGRGPQPIRRRARAQQEDDAPIARRMHRQLNNDDDDNSSEEDRRPAHRPAQRPQAPRARPQSRAAQESADEAFARRLQRQLNQQ